MRVLQSAAVGLMLVAGVGCSEALAPVGEGQAALYLELAGDQHVVWDERGSQASIQEVWIRIRPEGLPGQMLGLQPGDRVLLGEVPVGPDAGPSLSVKFDPEAGELPRGLGSETTLALAMIYNPLITIGTDGGLIVAEGPWSDEIEVPVPGELEAGRRYRLVLRPRAWLLDSGTQDLIRLDRLVRGHVDEAVMKGFRERVHASLAWEAF